MSKEHIKVLRIYDELRFNLGFKTLVDFLKGNPNPSIERNNLEELNSYGCLYKLDEEEISFLIKEMLKKNLLYEEYLKGGIKVIGRTILGMKELYDKKLNFDLSKSIKTEKKLDLIFSKPTIITDKDKDLFSKFDFFLNKFNDEQKKAIISNSNSILTIAGPGSGKTTILTKRIEFLVKFKSIKEKNILAITFTKKAKEEMKHRLNKLGIKNVEIETFNSFSEKILRKYEEKIYGKKSRVINFREKIILIKNILKKIGVNPEVLFETYFTKRQLKEKTYDELFYIFVNDMFSILDYYKNLELDINKFYELERNPSKQNCAKTIYKIIILLNYILREKGFRDFSDQVIDTLNFFKDNKEFIPKFEHILIDEFQDLNKVQFELIKLLFYKNIFAVGDPRQAIYGWRGSNVKYIYDFTKYFDNTELILLKYNYRSGKKIVNLFNEIIKPLNYVDLISGRKSEGEIFLQEFENEKIEQLFVLDAIKNSKNKRSEIFVLARTNKILSNYEDLFRQQGIDFIIKSEEEYKNNSEPKENQVVLATVHSIKGMEAKEVYVVNCNTQSFPNKAKDNYVFELIKKGNNYDKYSEELRLLYVALSRAKDKLIITYTGKLSKFFNEDVLALLDKKSQKSLFDFSKPKSKEKILISDGNSNTLKNLLKNWRSEKAKSLGDIPSYMIISNEVINQLVEKKPSSLNDLENIKGLGPVKISKYGKELLRIIHGDI